MPIARESVAPAHDAPAGRLLVVSNRLPVTVTLDGDAIGVVPSVGGLATGLRGVHGSSESLWIGWSGVEEDLAVETQHALRDQLASLRLVAVPISADELAVFYERISNGVLWPMFHDQLDKLPYIVEGWDVYETVNARFADAVAACYRPGDMIWVHDYHLMRLPALLRARLPDARIGFFLHIPFPNPEIFFALPCRRWLVEGMLGADVIGFHTRRYRGHFTGTLRRLFGLEMTNETIDYERRRVHLGVFPMGVDAATFAQRAGERDVAAEMLRLRADRNVRLLVGIDRLDYSKGLPRRLLALERLLERRPEWRERVRLVQVAVPSREGIAAYQRVRQTVEEFVGHINGRFATHRWAPVRYLYHSVPDTVLSALYRAADVLLVTPLRDGMNLVAKEFVASRTDGDGVLVLSEFAGAADELTRALIVNPYDVDGMAETINTALTMPREERRERMQAMRDHVMTHDVAAWAERFLTQLRTAS
ncbi:MAG: bifunctional alpha,alpha-trehalose-phosphate synthase (UDP-forming)/trehalose-phosphatase [Gemmatimonadaceae bacterium]